LLNRLQQPLQQTESRLEKMLTTGEVQVSSVSVDTVDKAVDITEVVKDSSVDNVDNVDKTSDSSRLYNRNRLYQVSHHQRIL
jgi:hypothetical protein